MTCEPWPITWPNPIDDVDADLLAVAAKAAQGLLWSMSGRRLGVCSTREAYRPACGGACGLPSPTYEGRDVWRNSWAAGENCCDLTLARQPVRDVSSVTVNGTVLDAGGYRVEGSTLKRVGACWECGEPCDELPVVVDYRYGADPPALAALAMGEVATEFLSLFQGGACRLPARGRRTISRNGTNIELTDPSTLVAIRRLGLPIADALIQMTNPNGLTARSRVYSPDLPRRV